MALMQPVLEQAYQLGESPIGVAAPMGHPSPHALLTRMTYLRTGNPMKRSLVLLIALLFCFLTPTAEAKRAPNLEMKDLAGATHKLADLRGSIVVLNFWATWCGPCRQELPMLSRLSQEYSAKPENAAKKVRFIAASADESKNRAKVDQFLSSNSLALDVWLGADLDMLDRAGLGNVLPATLILDEQGEIVARIMGQAREADIRAPLDWLLGGKVGPPPPASIKRY
jgi:thiol-disulfide isomerase/thioredoxin